MNERGIKGFSFYQSYWSAIQALSNEKSRKELAYAILQYAFLGDYNCDNDVVSMGMELIKPNIDVSVKRSQSGSAERGEKSNQNQTRNKSKSNQNQTRNDNDNDNDNDKEGEGEFPPPPKNDFFEKSLSDCRNELLNDATWLEVVCMNTRQSGHLELDLKALINHIKEFFRGLENEGVKEKSVKDAKSHFARWLKIELKKQKQYEQQSEQDFKPKFANVPNC